MKNIRNLKSLKILEKVKKSFTFLQLIKILETKLKISLVAVWDIYLRKTLIIQVNIKENAKRRHLTLLSIESI